MGKFVAIDLAYNRGNRIFNTPMSEPVLLKKLEQMKLSGWPNLRWRLERKV